MPRTTAQIVPLTREIQAFVWSNFQTRLADRYSVICEYRNDGERTGIIACDPERLETAIWGKTGRWRTPETEHVFYNHIFGELGHSKTVSYVPKDNKRAIEYGKKLTNIACHLDETSNEQWAVFTTYAEDWWKSPVYLAWKESKE